MNVKGGMRVLLAILAAGCLLAILTFILTGEGSSSRSIRSTLENSSASLSTRTKNPFPRGQGDARSSRNYPLSSIPGYINDLIANDRASADPKVRAWGDALEASFSDLNKADRILRQSFPPERYEAAKANLVVFLCSEKLASFGDALAMILDERERGGAASAVISAWSKKDPLALSQFAAGKLDGEIKNRALAASVEPLMRENRLADVLGVLANMPYSRARTESVELIAASWGGTDPSAALAWAESLEFSDERSAAFRRIIWTAQNGLPVEELIAKVNDEASEELRSLWLLAAAKRLTETFRCSINRCPRSFAFAHLPGALRSCLPLSAALAAIAAVLPQPYLRALRALRG